MASRQKDSADSGGGGGAGGAKEALSRLLKQSSAKLRARMTTADKLAPGGAAGEAALRQEAADSRKAGPVDLAALCPGTLLAGPVGACYLVEGRASEVVPAQGEVEKEYRRTFLGGAANVAAEELHESVRPLVDCPAEGVAYFDIETCGLAGMQMFLAGLLVWREGRLLVRQYLARDYAEERAVLARAWEELDRASVLVTFNGLTFDVPFLQDRSAACGLGLRGLRSQHVDLLPEARRRWKRLLPNCRLQTLEHFVCGRRRAGDIPGDQIPAVYHEFVRTGDARQIQVVLRHNAQDLVTLAELAARILQNRDADWL